MALETQIIILVVLIALSGFFSGIETAFFSLSRLRIKHLVKKRVKGAETVEKLRDKSHRLLVTILIGNNVVNIGASALATSIAFTLSMNNAVGITTGVMTLTILIFGEITPKTLATKYNQQISLLVAKPLLILQTIMLPIVVLFEGLTHLMTRMFGHSERPIVTEEEIKTFVSLGEEVGQIKESEKQMIHRIFKFDDLNAKDVMTARNRITGIPADKKIKDVSPSFYKKGHSRLPVYKGSLDNIIGFVHIMDIIKASSKRKTKPVRSIMRPITFVPQTKKLDSLLRFFQRKQQHIAIVVDEFGTNLGLVTMENVLEEIVGEIIDETEKIEPMIKKLKGKSYLVQGRADVDEINERCDLNLPEKEGPYTISNYILHHLGTIPKKGDIIKFTGCAVEIKKITKNNIERVVITQKK